MAMPKDHSYGIYLKLEQYRLARALEHVRWELHCLVVAITVATALDRVADVDRWHHHRTENTRCNQNWKELPVQANIGGRRLPQARQQALEGIDGTADD
jgi:hypothetical protein